MHAAQRKAGQARPWAAMLVLALPLAACGGDGGDSSPTPPGPTITIVKTATASGDAQTGAVGTPLPEPLRVQVQRDGAAFGGAVVNWTAEGGGSLAPSPSTADAQGIATTVWTLGPTAGPQTARAAVSGTPSATVAFTATATAEPPPAGTFDVSVENNVFDPAALTVRAGSKVVWTWVAGALQHNIVSATAGGPSEGSTHDAPHAFEFTFTQPGTYNYYCAVHGSPTGGMRGTITVVP